MSFRFDIRSMLLGGSMDSAAISGIEGVAALVDGGGAEIASALGFANAPTYAWAGNSASTAPTLVAGAAALSEAGTPTYSASVAKFNILTTAFDEASTDAFVAADTTPCNLGSSSGAFLFIGTLGAAPAGNSSIAQCRGGGSANEGWEFAALATGAVRFGIRRFGAFASRDVAAQCGKDIIALGVCDNANTNWSLYTDDDSSTGITSTAPAASTSAFAIGNQLFTSMGMNLALFCWWSGTAAEGLNGTHVTSLKTYLNW